MKTFLIAAICAILMFISFKAHAQTPELNTGPPHEIEHKIKKGENLWKISKRYGTTPELIKAANAHIRSIHQIFAGHTLKINPGNIACEAPVPASNQDTAASSPNVKSRSLDFSFERTHEEKMNIIHSASVRTGIPWDKLAGVIKQESDFGIDLIGDDGKSIGPAQINLMQHPEVSREQALDWEFSVNWMADHLIKLGYKKNPILALQKYNGNPKLTQTLVHAKAVLKHAAEFRRQAAKVPPTIIGA